MSNFTPEEELAHIKDVALDVVAVFNTYIQRSSEIDRAINLISLKDSIDSLKTWLPHYDYETGDIDWDKFNA